MGNRPWALPPTVSSRVEKIPGLFFWSLVSMMAACGDLDAITLNTRVTLRERIEQIQKVGHIRRPFSGGLRVMEAHQDGVINEQLIRYDGLSPFRARRTRRQDTSVGTYLADRAVLSVSSKSLHILLERKRSSWQRQGPEAVVTRDQNKSTVKFPKCIWFTPARGGGAYFYVLHA